MSNLKDRFTEEEIEEIEKGKKAYGNEVYKKDIKKIKQASK